MKKRFLMLLTVVALMMVMVAMSVAPAVGLQSPCPGNNGGIVTATGELSQYDRNGNGYVCKYDRYDKEFNLVSTRYRDDHSSV